MPLIDLSTLTSLSTQSIKDVDSSFQQAVVESYDGHGDAAIDVTRCRPAGETAVELESHLNHEGPARPMDRIRTEDNLVVR